jgi:hypothetical protein
MKQKLATAARILHLAPRRVRRYWENAVKVVEAHEFQNIVELAQKNRLARLHRQAEEVENLRRQLRETDEDMARWAPPAIGVNELLDPGTTAGKDCSGTIDDVCFGRGLVD